MVQELKQWKKNKILGLRVSALIEILLLNIVIILLAYFSGNSDRFFNVSPSPYWIIIILVTTQYGVNEGVFSACICSMVLLIGNIPAQSIDQTTYSYYLYVISNPLMWFIASVILGLLRSKHITQQENLKFKYSESTKREKEITEGFQRLKSVKEMLERRVASQLTSVAKGYEVISNSQSLSNKELLERVPDVISETLNPDKFSIFLIRKDGLSKAYAHGWLEKDKYALFFSKESSLYQNIVSNQYDYLTVTTEAHQNILLNEGVLACKLVNKLTGSIFGMIKIEKLDFMELNTSTMATFSALCDWLSSAYTNSLKYQEAEENQYINKITKLYTNSYYEHQKEFLLTLSKKYHFPLYSMNIHLNLDSEESYQINPVLSLKEAVDASTPPDVILYESKQKNIYHTLIRSNDENKVRDYMNEIKTNFKTYTDNEIFIDIKFEQL